MIATRAELVQYCLRRLGAPVMQINIDPTQIEDRIDDAIQQFWTFHGDGTIKNYTSYKITSNDKTNKYITLPTSVTSVIKVFPFSNTMSSNNLEYQHLMLNVLNIGSLTSGGMGNFMVFQQYISTLNELFNREKTIRFSSVQNRLYIDDDWNDMNVDDYLMIECYLDIDPSAFPSMYNDIWFKDYCTALIKKNWGQNLIKYDNFQLPSGITLNGRQIYDDAVAELQVLDEQINNTYQLPVDMMWG